MPVIRKHLRAALTALFAAASLWLLVSPQPAAANVNCGATPQTLNFGTSQTTTGTVDYRCTNFDPFPNEFTLCLRVGTSSYPGTPSQPRLQFQGNALDYNLYTDPAATQVWSATNFFTRTLTIPANQTINGTFTYYARIRAGQVVPLGTYTGQLFDTRLGFRTAAGQPCNREVAPNLQGVDFTINVQGSVAPSCSLGAIGPLDFGTQPGLFDRADAVGSVRFTCPLGRAWTLSFDGGRHASSGDRRMRSPAGDYVPYGVYRDPSRTNPIAINGTLSGNGTGVAQTASVYGRVEPPTPPPVGQYQDFVVVTLGF